MKSLRGPAKPNNQRNGDLRDENGRSLSSAELLSLITATWDGPVRFGMTGPERSMLYRLASETGLRFRELRRVTPASFQLGEPTTVAVAVGHGRYRRRVVLPLSAETAEALGSFLIVPEADQPMFRVPDRPAAMLHDDLRAAKQASMEGMETDALRHSVKHREDGRT